MAIDAISRNLVTCRIRVRVTWRKNNLAVAAGSYVPMSDYDVVQILLHAKSSHTQARSLYLI